MNWLELAMAVRPLATLESHVDTAGRVLAVRPDKLLVWQPELLDWLFRSDAQLCHTGGRSLTPLFGPRSLLWSEGSRHDAYRRVLGPPLRGKRLAERHDLIAGPVHLAIDDLAAGREADLLDWTRGIALRIIAGLLLGPVDDTLLAGVTDWADKAFGARHRTLAYRYLFGGLPGPDPALERRLVRAAHGCAPPALAERLRHGPLAGIGDRELRDAVVSLLFAGHETTAAGAAWTLYWLGRNASIRHDVEAELAATGSDGSNPAAVPLLQAVVLESLRLTPPATLAGHRTVPEDRPAPGRDLAAGTTLTPAIYAAHRHPDAWPEPTRFDPGRFRQGRPLPQHYLPFGGGSRYCLGSQLALLEIRMIAAALLLRRRRWRLAGRAGRAGRLRGQILAPAGVTLRVPRCQR
ncbi:cytochrome P450 [Actinophytocola sp.]|uniref:cytochrome P450 n=1 Tax=Actinophytocola sp. TaxID=1872138 RepID=UPI002D7F6E68|nr:cytochrome P450 [Actinophytocola sp.]HET9142823.1 cytochrome P450 [Actinophytocola sp.]